MDSYEDSTITVPSYSGLKYENMTKFLIDTMLLLLSRSSTTQSSIESRCRSLVRTDREINVSAALNGIKYHSIWTSIL